MICVNGRGDSIYRGVHTINGSEFKSSEETPARKKRSSEVGQGPNKVLGKHFRLAIDNAKKCKPEWAGKLHPKVGVVIVKNAEVIATAYRGEVGKGNHAEFIAPE